VGGTWKLSKGELTLEQSFQMITGTLTSSNVSTPVNGKLSGNQISFTAGDKVYTGNVSGNSMYGNLKGGNIDKWIATRMQQ